MPLFDPSTWVQKGIDPKIKDSEGTALDEWVASLGDLDPTKMTSSK